MSGKHIVQCFLSMFLLLHTLVFSSGMTTAAFAMRVLLSSASRDTLLVIVEHDYAN